MSAHTRECDNGEGRLTEGCPGCTKIEAYYHGLYGHMSRDQLRACDPRPGISEEDMQAMRDAERVL